MASSLMKSTAYRLLILVLWFLLLVGLPLTSFPILSQLTGAVVAPFSAIPLLLLMILWLVPYLMAKGKFPVEIVPLLYFILISMIVSALAFFLDGYYSRGRDFLDQILRAFLTLGIGLSFYLVFSAFPNSVKMIRQTLLFITIGGVLLMMWTLLEVVLLRIYGNVLNLPEWFLSIRSLLAVQSPTVLYTNRVTGFAYEPSWFVRQFNLVLFPIWLSAVYQRRSIFNVRLWKFQVEDGLLAVGVVVFGFSSPRIGLLAFLASLGVLGVMVLRRMHRWLTTWYLNHRKQMPKRIAWTRFALAVLMVLVMVSVIASALMGYILVASRWDERYALLLQASTIENLDVFPLTEGRLITMARQLAFFERMVYWFGGWNIFNDYPFGVGLGNAGFYFADRMHGSGFDSLEIRNLIYRASYLPNTKNLWTRLLSETGFIGLAVFLVWLYLLWRSSGLIRKSSFTEMKILGLAGQLFLVAYLVEGFSMDSFAIPYEWIMAGLISAGGVLVRQEFSTKRAEQAALNEHL